MSVAPVVEMVDTSDLKSDETLTHAGSIPARSIKDYDKYGKCDHCDEYPIVFIDGVFIPFTPPRKLCRRHYKLFREYRII